MNQRPIHKPKPIRATVIKGAYTYDAGVWQKSREAMGIKVEHKGVKLGRIELDSDADKGFVALNYRPEGYGVKKVETLEEREARYKADIERLKNEAEEREKQAFQKGLKQGRAKGFEKGSNQVAAEIERMTQLLQSVVTATENYFRQVEDRLADFAMMIARKVVGETAEAHREIAVQLAKAAIKEATDRTKITLLVNEVDYEMLNNARADLKTISEGIKKIEIEINNRVSPGGVLLETAGGSIDASIETMLDEVYRTIAPGYEVPGEGGGE